MRLVGHPDKSLAREIAEVAHGILASRADIHELEGLIVQQIEKLVDLSEHWIQLTRVATN